jgi:hypothetical protein
MDMVLLDWTRMGKSYCLAGVVIEEGRLRVVRPLLARNYHLPLRNVGWSAYLLDGRSRWEVLELVGPTPAQPEPPHLEDVWVRELRPRHCLAPPEQRRAILEALVAEAAEDPFGAPLLTMRAGAYLAPGQGRRSLATLEVPGERIRFTAARRDGAAEADIRVTLGVPPLEDRLLPVKDHLLLLAAERSATTLSEEVQALHWAVEQMGAQVVVRLGLSRAFATRSQEGLGWCWLMADGFLSLAGPQS